MKIYSVLRLTSTVIILLSLFSCGNNKTGNGNKNAAVKELIASYPQGKISSFSGITVTFKKPLRLNGIIQDGIFKLSPQVEGKTYRSGEKSLTFQPLKPLEYNREYKITLNLDKIFEKPDEDVFVFEIKTLPLTVSAGMMKILPVSLGNTKLNRGEITLRFSETVDNNSLKNAITVKQKDLELPFSITEEQPSDVFTLTVDSIIRYTGTSQLVLSLDMKELSSEGVRKWTFPVNSINKFDFVNWELLPGKEKIITLYFSDPIDENQNINGLIYFNDNTPFDYTVDKNIVKLYLQNVNTGKKELTISAALRNIKNRKLNRKTDITVFLKPAGPQVQFIGSGTVVAGGKNTVVPFKTINLNAVDVVVFKIYQNNVKQFLQNNAIGGNWELRRVGDFVFHKKIVLHKTPLKEPANRWENYSLDLSKMINTDPGSIYRIYLKFKKEYSMLACNEGNDLHDGGDDENGENYLYGDYYYPADYSWEESEEPCSRSYYNYSRFAAKNVFTTAIGLTAKMTNKNTYEIFVNNLITSKPEKDVNIDLFDFQQQKIASGKTGEKGFFKAACKKEVAFVVAHKGNSYAYLRTLGGNVLSLSKFDTQGVKAENGVKGFIYSERGVRRPGDTIFLNFVLQDVQNSIPEGHPLVLNVFDAQNKPVYSKTVHISGVSIYSFAVPTGKDDPTGIWHAKITLGGNRFDKRLRVENIKPNRLKIDIDFGNTKIITQKNSFAAIKAQWLNGGIASNLKALVTGTFTVSKSMFEDYKSYVFDDPSKQFYPDESTVFDGKLDENGDAKFKIDLPRGKYLPSMLNLSVVAKVFEPGGGFSIEQKEVKYAPFDRYVGIESPRVDKNSWLETGKKNVFKLVLLNAGGKPVSSGELQVEVYKLKWSWWYRNGDEQTAYISRNYKQRIINETVKIRGGKGLFNLTVKYPDWGIYFVRVVDKVSGNSAGTTVYIDWPSGYSRNNRKALSGATLLNITSDKKKYVAGEKVRISFPVPPNAEILVSIEKNNRQLKWWWSENVSDNEKVLEFTATGEMAPNVYLYVSVLQPHGQTENDLPLRLYGVIPVFVEDPDTKLIPRIDVPGNIRPNANYSIKVSEEKGREMEYTIAVVDEGLLRLTNFKTPDPYGYFYSKEALAVKTWDMYDEVAGAFAGRLLRQFAVGGDEELAATGKKMPNRFAPVVKFMGPFKLEKGKTDVHNLKMDNYTGAVRVMVVAANKTAYGKAEKDITVKQPVMVTATLPRMLVPGELIKLPVTVFNMGKAISEVKVSVSVNSLFSIEKPEKTVTFDKPGDKTLFFDLHAGNNQGTGKVSIKAVAGNESASYNISIAIRNPNKRQYRVSDYRVSPAETLKLTPVYPGLPGSRQLKITASVLPPVNLERRLDYIINYPYGCVEQTVSSVFPQLFLDRLVVLSDTQKERINNNVISAIENLNRFRTGGGGFAYWPGGIRANDWGSSYAGHFLLLAKDNGYFVSPEVLNDWINYQRRASNVWEPDYYNDVVYNGLNQAYRLYTLALAGKPNIQAMNRLMETEGLNRAACYRLAAAYAVIGRNEAAETLLDRDAESGSGNGAYPNINFGSRLRDYALMLETHYLLGDHEKTKILFEKIAASLCSNKWLSTQSIAFGLYAVALYGGNNENNGSIDLEWERTGKREHVKSDKPYVTISMEAKDDELRLVNRAENDLFVTVTASGIPAAGEVVDVEKNLKMDIVYRDIDNSIIDIDKIKQGRDFYAEIIVKNSGGLGDYEHMALSFAVPPGWEIINTRLWKTGEGLGSDKPEYMDIKDDRVNMFFDLREKESKRFVILLNAAYPGVFYIPNTTCEEMYNHSITAAKGGGKTEVVK
jgi:uncharacterized protein YfaS (alpha-2-macroglobulin family)